MLIKVDLSGMKELQDQLRRLNDPAVSERVRNAAVNRVAGETLSRAIMHTPVKTGHLRRNWHATPAVDGIATVSNNTEYAAFVEYGHRQQPGRFVPAIGKRLVRGWIPGQHMLQKAIQDVEPNIESMAANAAMKELKKLGGKR